MCDVCELLRKAEETEQEENEALEKLLREAGYEFVPVAIEQIKRIEQEIEEALQADYEEIVALVLVLMQGEQQSEKQLMKLLGTRDFISTMAQQVIPEFEATFIRFAESFSKEYSASFNVKVISKLSKKIMEKWFKELPELMKLNTDNSVIKLIVEAYENGKGIVWLEQQLAKLPSFSHYRARLTAITEVLSMYSSGAYESFLQNDVVKGMEWKHSYGIKEPRKTHLDLSGTVVDKGKMFMVNGEMARFPRDPLLSAKERISCHCLLVPVLKDEYLEGIER